MINLGPRLLCAASFVRCRTKITDIGTDHAYLPAYLIENGIADSVLACDIGVMPLKNAENTVKSCGLSDKIALRISDGLKEVSPEEADEIIICGMGGTLMTDILTAAPWVRREGMHLILQPMTHSEDVRKYLLANGFSVTEEKFVTDEGKVYCCISADFDGIIKESDEGFCQFGFLPPKDETNARYVEKQLHRVDVKLCALKGREVSAEEYERLKEIRNYYEKRTER